MMSKTKKRQPDEKGNRGLKGDGSKIAKRKGGIKAREGTKTNHKSLDTPRSKEARSQKQATSSSTAKKKLSAGTRKKGKQGWWSAKGFCPAK